MSSSYFERLPELADKLGGEYNVNSDQLREFLFQNALDEGDLDSDLEDIYPEAQDVDEARSLASSSDFPDYIPFEGFDIDPDYEELNAFRLAAENPKVREFLSRNNDLSTLIPGETLDDARDAYLQSVNSGSLTPQQRSVLERAGSSRFLHDEGYSSAVGEALNNILQAYTDRYNVDYSQNLSNVDDVLAEAASVINPIETDLNARDTLLRYALSRSALDPYASRINRNTVQLGLPLLGDPSEIDSRYETIRNNPPQTRNELRSQVEELQSLQRRSREQGAPNRFLIEGSSLLPQVSDFLTRGQSPNRRDFLLDAAERQAADPNRNSLYDLVRDLNQENIQVSNDLEAERMARAVNMSPAAIDPLIPSVSSVDNVQFGIPGLEDQLLETKEIAQNEAVKQLIPKINAFVEEYPEVGPYLQGFTENPTPKIERDLQKLSPYLDLEQTISKPETRQDIYNLAMKELGVLPSYLEQIEADYTSGDTLKQQNAVDRLIEMGYGDILKAGSSPAVSKRMPVVGGGGYATGDELRDAASFITKRAKDFEKLKDEFRFLRRSSNSNLLKTNNPNLSAAPTEAFFSYDPDTETASFDPRGDYGIRLNLSQAPSQFSISNDLPSSRELSRNVLNYLKDNPVTSMSSISFETRTPTEQYFSYEPKDIPAPVFDQMNKFISENVLRNLRPGMIMQNSPIGSSDLVALRESQGKSPSESSILRRQQQFVGQQPNRRGAAYRSVGFGPLTQNKEQLLYMNSEGNVVPLQPSRPAASLRGRVDFEQNPLRAEVTQSREPLTSKAYYAVDPISAAVRGVPEYLSAIKRTPSALLPGAADLIPSPEAIQTGYAKGPVEMGKQMAAEFAQSLPSAAAASAVLSTPAIAPLAPGIGAGLVGTAGAKALNEVVRQQTGEGIVPKIRQAIGTKPRSGKASRGYKPPSAEYKPAQITKASPQAVANLEKQRTQNELQRRMQLARERFNPAKGEFGLTEMLFGR